jgi:3-oxoacyl-[acyl-carrier-protein] synthase-3
MPDLMNAPNAASDANPPRPEPAPGYSGRSRLSSLTGVAFLGTGSYVPDTVITNEDLAAVGYDSDWILQRTGILARRRLPDDLATSDMAVSAAEQCLAAAGVDRSQIDLVLVATMTPDMPSPSTACLVQERLGLRCAAMDLNAACAGFMYGLITGAQFIRTGSCRHVLVIGGDTNTRIVNPHDRKTFPLFGDAAGAVLLGPGRPTQGLRSFTLGAEGEGASLLSIPAGGSRRPTTAELIEQGATCIHMDGRSVFKWAVRLLVDTVQDVVKSADLSLEDVKLVILHQANFRILDAAATSLGLRPEQVFMNLERYGNTSAGSIPLALDEAFRGGRIAPGDRVLLCGFGAGLAWGAAVIEW